MHFCLHRVENPPHPDTLPLGGECNEEMCIRPVIATTFHSVIIVSEAQKSIREASASDVKNAKSQAETPQRMQRKRGWEACGTP
jgi:hypothetical protein